MSGPLISIITPTLNCGELLDGCIESVLAQNYPRCEHIIMDGGSTDGTLSVLERHKHLVWRSEPDSGEANALNRALKMVKGDLVLWLNADDYLTPGALARVAEVYAQHAQPCVIYGDIDYIDEDGKFLMHQQSAPVADLPLFLRWWRNLRHPHQPAIFYGKEVVDTVGAFREDLFFAIDQEYQLRAVLHYPFHYAGMTLAVQRIRKSSKSWEAGKKCTDVHRAITLAYVRYLKPSEKLSFWFDYGIQHFVPIPAELKMRLKIRTRLRELFAPWQQKANR